MAFARRTWDFLPEQRIWGIKSASVARYFVWTDVLTFLVQAVGGIMTSPGASANVIQISLNIYLAGMDLQQLFVILFMTLLIIFHWCVEATSPKHIMVSRQQRSWKTFHTAPYIVLAPITVR